MRKHDKSRPRDGEDAVTAEVKPEVLLGDLYLRGFFVSLFDWNETSTPKKQNKKQKQKENMVVHVHGC